MIPKGHFDINWPLGKFHILWEGWQKIWPSWIDIEFRQIMVVPFSEYMNFTLSIYTFLTKRKLYTKSWVRFLILWEVRKEGENLKNQTLYAFRHPLMLVEIFTRFLFWLLILWGNTVCAINLSLPSFIFFRYFVYFVKDFSFFSVC